MNPTSKHPNRPTRTDQDRNQLPLALATPQASEYIPNEVHMRCLPLWRELLQVVLKGKDQTGGSYER